MPRLKASTNDAPRVIAVGEALLDMLANDFDVPREEVRSWTPKAGGAACNVAAALAKLGIPVAFVTAVGEDDLGKNLLAVLDGNTNRSATSLLITPDAGVILSEVQRRPEPTRDVYVTRTSGGEREFVGFGGPADIYADCHIAPHLLPVKKIRGAEVVVLGTLGQAFVETGEAVRRAAAVARESGVCVFVDVNWRPVFFSDPSKAHPLVVDLVRKADLVKLTNEEAEWLFGIDSIAVMNDPSRVLNHLPSAHGVLVTAGEEGAAYCMKSTAGLHSGFVPAFDVDVVDTTGAGDAFTSGFIYCMLKAGGLRPFLASPSSIDDAVLFASASGGVTASGAGAIEAQPTSVNDVESLIGKTRS